ncbi:MAG: FIST C-terminal domain-containing protein [Pontiellaceae bacterium]|nr:FIST C-terminal domain-containing protein [Pontiellaceae bacterium]
MQVEQQIWKGNQGWKMLEDAALSSRAQLVFLFGDFSILRSSDAVDEIKKHYPEAYVLGCSAGGAIHDAEIADEALVATAVWFERTTIRAAAVDLESSSKSGEVGEQLAQELLGEDLCHIFVLSDGLTVHGDALVQGFMKHLPEHIRVTGGLAGDGELFQDSLVIADAPGRNKRVAAVGFYGKHLVCGCGSQGGWSAFGPSRRVTRAEGKRLYEVDGKPALDLYKRYLGPMADGLPSTGVYFPLNVTVEGSSMHLVRTVISVDEEQGALVFGGDIPLDSTVTLMHANMERLVEGAEEAGRICRDSAGTQTPQLSLLVSCTARKIVLKQRTEEEVEAVRDVFAGAGCQAGFYSFGEICPPTDHSSACEFHNQTMTITTFCELKD